MRVAFQLRRRAEPAPAAALLLPSHQTADLLRLLARLGEPPPRVHPVADGFVLKLHQPPREPPPGVVRLRALADNFLLPADADLVPPLLDDEAAALVRRRGLVFLPGGRILEYEPDRPLSLRGLLALPDLRRGGWQPLPELPPTAEQITEISLAVPDESADDILDVGGAGIGTEEPRPPASGLPAKVVGKGTFALGKGLAWLGRVLHLRGLARAGARMMAAAAALAPRLSEAILGKQEASLRALLRDFREGNIERALRRALPLRRNAPRGAGLTPGSRLGSQDPRYSLDALLAGDHGAGAGWLASVDTFYELEREYRKLAEQATRAGDYRRAAFIYGKLLEDYRAAAAALSRAGLHHDAAVLYLAKLQDTLAAAREYEAAGEVDRALRLYRQGGEHALAGDLLRRAGEEELAVAEYQLAALRLIETGQGHFQAGELLRTRAGRADLALPCYAEGWARRPGGAFGPCARRLVQHHAQAGAGAPLLAVVAEAEAFFRPAGHDTLAGEFFNEVARLAGEPSLAAHADDLRDRALVALAGKMRQQAAVRRAGGSAAKMLAAEVWAPAVVSDGQFAVRAALRQPAPLTREPAAPATPLGAPTSVVRAACQAPTSGLVFLGLESGEVISYHPGQGTITVLANEQGPVLSLATTDRGNTVAALRQRAPGEACLSLYSGTGGWLIHWQTVATPGEADAWLCPLIGQDPDEIIALWTGEALAFYRCPYLLAVNHWDLAAKGQQPAAALLLPAPRPDPPPLAVLTLRAHLVNYFRDHTRNTPPQWKTLGWVPGLPSGSTLEHPAVSWMRTSPDTVVLAGVAADGTLHLSALQFEDGSLDEVTVVVPWSDSCLAATLVRPEVVAAVTRSEVRWLRLGRGGFTVYGSAPLPSSPAVAAFPVGQHDEVLVVCADATVIRVGPRVVK